MFHHWYHGIVIYKSHMTIWCQSELYTDISIAGIWIISFPKTALWIECCLTGSSGVSSNGRRFLLHSDIPSCQETTDNPDTNINTQIYKYKYTNTKSVQHSNFPSGQMTALSKKYKFNMEIRIQEQIQSVFLLLFFAIYFSQETRFNILFYRS